MRGLRAIALISILGLAGAQTPTAPGNNPSLPSFEVASIKPNKSGDMRVMMRILPGGGYEATGVPLKFLLEEAFNIKDDQLSQSPPWMDSEHWDIKAKTEESVGAEIDKLPMDQRKDRLMQMLQSLLIERCKLEVGHEKKELPIYALVIAKSGVKMKKSDFVPPDKPQGALPPIPRDGSMPRGMMRMDGRGKLEANGAEMAMLVNTLSRFTGRTVVDKTGLTGRWDFTLQWTPDNPMGPGPGGPGGPGSGPPPEASGPSLFTAVQEQLGLKLESEKAPVDILVIKHVERPSEN